MMLKKRDLHEVPVLFELASHPAVAPYIRHQAQTVDEYYFMTKQMMDGEENGEVISRTILDEYEQPIGTISLFDIQQNTGFLATWIGAAYFGQGYNRLAKDAFLEEIFTTTTMEYVFIKVKRINVRSKMAVLKLPFITEANEIFPTVYEAIHVNETIYDLFVITKAQFMTYMHFTPNEHEETEIVS